MKRRIFDRQFKIEAVRLACFADMNVTQTARTLNISATTLYRWIAEWEQVDILPALKGEDSYSVQTEV